MQLAAAQLQGHLQKGLRPLYALHGDEPLLVQEALDAIRARARELGYGERRQLELAMAPATRPQFLLLDEPMAGMSVQESAAVATLLQSLKGRYTMLLVEHDMNAVFALADRISVLVYGRLLTTGTPEEIRSNTEVRNVYLGDEEVEAA